MQKKLKLKSRLLSISRQLMSAVRNVGGFSVNSFKRFSGGITSVSKKIRDDYQETVILDEPTEVRFDKFTEPFSLENVDAIINQFLPPKDGNSVLIDSDIQSATWQKVRNYAQARQNQLLNENTADLDAIKTSRLRGRIAELKLLLALEKKPAPIQEHPAASRSSFSETSW